MFEPSLYVLAASEWVAPAATLTVGAVSASLVLRQLALLRRKNEFDVLTALSATVARRFDRGAKPSGQSSTVPDGSAAEFYALRRRFADVAKQPGLSRDESLEERIDVLVNDLSDSEYRSDLKIVHPVVNALSALGEAVENGYVSRETILARYHLLIIRDVYLIEPYVIREVALLQQRGRWGLRALALGEIARAYNDMNPIHRSPVFFLQDNLNDTEYGAVHHAPDLKGIARLRLVAWWLRRTVGPGYPGLNERRKRRQKADLERRRNDLATAPAEAAAGSPAAS